MLEGGHRNRLATLLWYLRSPAGGGGETHFPRAGGLHHPCGPPAGPGCHVHSRTCSGSFGDKGLKVWGHAGAFRGIQRLHVHLAPRHSSRHTHAHTRRQGRAMHNHSTQVEHKSRASDSAVVHDVCSQFPALAVVWRGDCCRRRRWKRGERLEERR